jgi:RNA polymerase sigma-70 factor, ECF subfamily
VYDTLAPAVYGLVLRMLRDQHEAEEVTGEIFLGLWQSASRFDPARGTARAWVLTMAHRRAVDRVRSNDRTRPHDETYTRATMVAPLDQNNADALGPYDARRVRAALVDLSPIHREAIGLAYFGGHTHVEVGHLLHLPPATTRTRIRDGLLRLRDSLAIADPTSG